MNNVDVDTSDQHMQMVKAWVKIMGIQVKKYEFTINPGFLDKMNY